jgi:cytochrome b
MDKGVNKTKVWDLFVRFFHWTLVSLVGIAYLTQDHLLDLHVLAGLLILGLVFFRIIWGFIGTPHARFSDFVFRPRVVFEYLKELVTLKARRYIGHGPAGGAMVVALLLGLLATTLSGLALFGGQEYQGPLAGLMAGLSGSWTEAAEEAHEFLAGMILFLASVHVAGVLYSSWAHHENLIRAMFTGKKQVEESPPSAGTEQGILRESEGG